MTFGLWNPIRCNRTSQGGAHSMREYRNGETTRSTLSAFDPKRHHNYDPDEICQILRADMDHLGGDVASVDQQQHPMGPATVRISGKCQMRNSSPFSLQQLLLSTGERERYEYVLQAEEGRFHSQFALVAMRWQILGGPVKMIARGQDPNSKFM